MKNKYLLFLFIILSNSIYSQVNLDSLWAVWEDNTMEDTVRLDAMGNFTFYGYLKNKPDSAIHFALIQHEFAKERGYNEYSADAMDIIGRAYESMGVLSEAVNYYEKAYKLYETVGNSQKSARSLYEIAGVKWTEGEYELAKEYHHRSLAIANEIGDLDRMTSCLNGLAYCFYNQGQFVEAVDHVKQSLRLSDEMNDDYGTAWGLNAIGSIYSSQGDEEKALEYYLKGLEINERIGDKSSIAYSLRNIGNFYYKLGDKVTAMDFYERTLTIGEELNDKRNIAYSLSSIGEIHEDRGEFIEALNCYQESLTLAREIGNKDMECELLLDIGSLHMDRGNYTLGIKECKKSFKLALDIGSVDDQLAAAKCLYKSYKELGNNAQALEYFELFHILNDSLKLEETARSLQNMEFNNKMFADSVQHAEDKRIMEQAYQEELLRKDQTRNIIFISGIIMLFIAGGLYNRMQFIRKANARLEKEKDRAEKSEQFKQQFLANMSHEIRTPMNAIKGMIDILIRRKPKVDQKKYLNGIKESSNSLLILINDILDLSKIEVGKIELELIPFSITDIIKNVDTIMRFKAEEKGLLLKSDIPTEIPVIVGDPSRFQQIIINLVGNAIKFTEKGTVTTSVKLEDAEIDGHIVAHIMVSDTGIGISSNQIKKVFNSFEQAYTDTSRIYGGTGLGLSITKKLIELHNGKIWVESKVGKGSQFHFTIPYLLCYKKENLETDSIISDTDELSQQLKGVKVLLVEDNEFNAVVAKEELEDSIDDTSIIVAENGAKAVEVLKNNDFDIVLMDVQMPIMNGYEATKEIREFSNQKSNIPIIAMTANVLKEEVELCYKAGMNDFISKPFETEVLIQKIHKLVNPQT